MIALIDYGISNLRSVEKAFAHLGSPVTRTENPADIARAEKLVLPGVGAFAAGMAGLSERGLVGPLIEAARAGTPLLGICLGMQLLFERSEEGGDHAGLGILPGRVVRLRPEGLPVPHMGWNQINAECGMQNAEWGTLRFKGDSPSPACPDRPLGQSREQSEGEGVGGWGYFVHSYICEPADPGIVLATTDYGGQFAAVVGRGNVFGIQFHPEKSQAVGLTILRNFIQW